MATTRVEAKNPVLVPPAAAKQSAALRLLSAERSEEIFPILLEEIVSLGFPKAMVLEVDFDSGEVKPTASLNFERRELEKFRASLWASENPIVSALQNLNPAVLPSESLDGQSLYTYPMVYRSRTRCWEAERGRRNDCLAMQNFSIGRKLPLEEQVCAACGMRAYATLVVAKLGRNTSETQLRDFRNLAERANGYLARLFKVEHYYNRMRDMEVTISRLRAVMQSMPDPVILTDNQHRVIIQNRAAEHFFRVPEGVSEGG